MDRIIGSIHLTSLNNSTRMGDNGTPTVTGAQAVSPTAHSAVTSNIRGKIRNNLVSLDSFFFFDTFYIYGGNIFFRYFAR